MGLTARSRHLAIIRHLKTGWKGKTITDRLCQLTKNNSGLVELIMGKMNYSIFMIE